MRTIAIVSLVGLLLGAPLVASAGNTHDPGVNARQHQQRQRIGEGWRSGELTPHERLRLTGQQYRLAREERRYKSDGVLTRAERVDLQRDLNRTSRSIYRQKHDAQTRN